MITASIVTYNNEGVAVSALKSVAENTKKYPVSFFVIDNNSSDRTVAEIEETHLAKIIKYNKNTGFGAAHNAVLQEKTGKYHAVINPDITVDRDVLSALADILEENDDICMVMPKILNPDGSEQHLPKRTPTIKYLFGGRLARLGGPFRRIRNEFTMSNVELKDITDIDFCSGCFFMIRSSVFKEIGGFDEKYFMYLEDADLTRMAKEHGRTVFCPTVSVTHCWERASAKNIKLLMIHISSFLKYLKKWGIKNK